MQFFFILWLIFAVAVTIFAALNASPVKVNLIFNSYDASLALVILGSAFVGALAGYTVDMVPRIKNKLKIRELDKKLKTAEADLDSCRAKLNTVTGAPQPAVQENLENQGTV